MSEPADLEFEAFLEYLRDSRGFDFRGYKRASLMRRVRRRMDEAGVAGFPAYREHLEANPGEFTALFDTRWPRRWGRSASASG